MKEGLDEGIRRVDGKVRSEKERRVVIGWRVRMSGGE